MSNMVGYIIEDKAIILSSELPISVSGIIELRVAGIVPPGVLSMDSRESVAMISDSCAVGEDSEAGRTTAGADVVAMFL